MDLARVPARITDCGVPPTAIQTASEPRASSDVASATGSGAVIAAEAQPRPGGYYWWRGGCYYWYPNGA